MAAVFAAYLSVKGLKRVWGPEPWMVALIGAGFFSLTFAVVNPLIAGAPRAWTTPSRPSATCSIFR